MFNSSTLSNLFKFFAWRWRDVKSAIKNRHNTEMSVFGTMVFCGRQGDGKTSAMVWYAEKLRKKYPNAVIVSNFGYKHEHKSMESWRDLLDIRNGTDGVIFLIDELQNEFASAINNKHDPMPEFLLQEITQQRKQRVHIVATSQIFTRVRKELREQVHTVVQCRNRQGRWFFLKAFDADDYNTAVDNLASLSNGGKRKIKRLWRANFIQTDELRNMFDSYSKISRLKKITDSQLAKEKEREVNNA